MQDKYTEWFYNTLFDLNVLTTFLDFLWEKIGLFIFIYLILVYMQFTSVSKLKVKIRDVIKINEDPKLINDLNKELNKTEFNSSLVMDSLVFTIIIMFVAYMTTFSGAAWLLSS